MTWHNEIRVNVFYSLKKAPVKPNNENESCQTNTLETFYKNSQVPYKKIPFSNFRCVTLLRENISEVFTNSFCRRSQVVNFYYMTVGDYIHGCNFKCFTNILF